MTVAIKPTKSRKASKTAAFKVGKNGLPILPDAGTLDFTNGKELCGYSMLALTLMNQTGAFLDSRLGYDTKESEPYIYAALSYVDEIDRHLLQIPASQLLDALADYDLFHHIMRKRPVPCNFWENIYRRILTSIQQGERGVDEGMFVMTLQSWLAGNKTIGTAKFKEFVENRLRRWYSEAPKYHLSKDATAPHTIQKVTALLLSDLSSIDSGNDLIKRMLALRYSDCFDDLTLYDNDTLMALRTLIRSCPQHFPKVDAEATDVKILRLLAWSPTLHPFMSEAFRQDLSFRQGWENDT